jgi:hypothetical protein
MPPAATTSGALACQQRVGWQPSRFLSDRAKAERAFALAEQLGSVNAAAATRRAGQPTTPTLDPVFVALNQGQLPAARGPMASGGCGCAAPRRSRRSATAPWPSSTPKAGSVPSGGWPPSPTAPTAPNGWPRSGPAAATAARSSAQRAPTAARGPAGRSRRRGDADRCPISPHPAWRRRHRPAGCPADPVAAGRGGGGGRLCARGWCHHGGRGGGRAAAGQPVRASAAAGGKHLHRRGRQWTAGVDPVGNPGPGHAHHLAAGIGADHDGAGRRSHHDRAGGDDRSPPPRPYPQPPPARGLRPPRGGNAEVWPGGDPPRSPNSVSQFSAVRRRP